MLVEFSIFRINECTPISNSLAEAVKLVEASGLSFRLSPSSVCVEGGWEEVLLLIRKCHESVRLTAARVMTTISLEDEEGVVDKFGKSHRSVEEKITHPRSGWRPKIRNVKPSKDEAWV